MCGKNGNFSRDCRFKRSHNNEAKFNSAHDELVETLSEVISIHGKVSGWWYDTCATIHVTYDRTLFKTFESSKEGHEIKMGNDKRSKVEGKGTIDLFFASAKKVLLTNFLYVS